MRCTIRSLAAYGLLVAHSPRVSSQQPTPPEPLAVVRTAFHAYEAKRWSDFAMLVDADALADFRNQNLEFAEIWEKHASEIHAAQKQMKGGSDFAGNPTLYLMGIKTVAEMRALSPADLLARYLDTRDPKLNPRDPDYRPPIVTREIIGEVGESPDLVHVVYRVHADVGRYGRTESVEVVPVKRVGSDWRLLLNGDLARMGGMEAIVTDKPPE